MLSERQAHLFQTLMREYIRTAEPVGSSRLAELSVAGVSSATIRMDLAELEEAGYLTHPHTSAGRVPTEAGYRYFIKHFMPEESSWQPAKDVVRELRDLRSKREELLRNLTHTLADLTGETAFASVGPDELVYTGLTNLFAKPEFQNVAEVLVFSEMLDRMDEVVHSVFASVRDEARIFIGSENPFGTACGTILLRVRVAPRTSGLLGLVGPMRMDYERNVAIMSSLKNVLNEVV